jgi:hypothetical protein
VGDRIDEIVCCCPFVVVVVVVVVDSVKDPEGIRKDREAIKHERERSSEVYSSWQGARKSHFHPFLGDSCNLPPTKLADDIQSCF